MPRKKSFSNSGVQFSGSSDQSLAGLVEGIDASAFSSDNSAENEVLEGLQEYGFKRTLQASNGRIQRGNFVLTMTGLEYNATTPPEYEEWRELGEWLNQLRDSTQWMIGDWVQMGVEHAADWMPPALLAELEAKSNDTPEGKYKWLAGLVDLSYSTLRNIAYVSGAFPVSRRRDTLTFSHHAEVASLEPDEQEHFLNLAEPDANEGKRLSVRNLRQLVQAKHPPQIPAGAKPRKDPEADLLQTGLDIVRKPPKPNASNRKKALEAAELYRRLALELESYANGSG